MIDATVGLCEAQWHLQRADFVGGSVWVRDSGAAIGASVRIRILARDVSVALNRLDHTSILNQLEGKVTAIAEDDHAGQVLVRVQVKSVALMR